MRKEAMKEIVSREYVAVECDGRASSSRDSNQGSLRSLSPSTQRPWRSYACQYRAVEKKGWTWGHGFGDGTMLQGRHLAELPCWPRKLVGNAK